MGTHVRVNETLFRTEMARNGFKSVVEFGADAGIPRATIDNMIAGRNAPSQQTIQAIFDALPKSKVEDLFAIFFTHEVT